jgi:hypothetical protein
MNLRPTLPAPGPASAADIVDRALAAPTFVDVTVPRTTVRGKMRLVTRAERFAAVADARRALEAAGMPVDASAVTALGAHEQWHYELGARLLAVAVRDPEATDRQLASVDDWRKCDDDQLDALWNRYQDLEAELDPLGLGAPLAAEDEAAIAAAAKKKDAAMLMSFGSRKLASYLLTSDDPPAISATPPS